METMTGINCVILTSSKFPWHNLCTVQLLRMSLFVIFQIAGGRCKSRHKDCVLHV